MLRAFLVILAILSAVLGVVLGLTLLYVLAVVLLVAAAGVWLLSLKGKFEIGRPGQSTYEPAVEDDLGSLGILEIRPRQGTPKTERAETPVATAEQVVAGDVGALESAQQYSIFESEERMSSVETHVREPVAAERNGTSRHEVSHPKPAPRASFRERKSSSSYQVASSSGAVNREVILPCLESLCAAVDANTVCLLGSEAGGKGHRILAIVSRNAYARGGGELTPGNGMRWSTSRYVTVERAADATWDPYDLQYYRETIAVKELAHVAVPVQTGERRFLLIADSMQDGVLSDARASRIIEQYSLLLGSLLGEADARREETETAFRPRREIIADEMERVRGSDSPLALALVMLNRAEEVAQTTPELVDDLEADVRERLEESTYNLRVERFGDLMFGVFVWAPVSDVESWALEVQEEFDGLGGDFSGGVSIGAAMLTDRHSTPEQLRADAAAALQEAVKSRVCTILD